MDSKKRKKKKGMLLEYFIPLAVTFFAIVTYILGDACFEKMLDGNVVTALFKGVVFGCVFLIPMVSLTGVESTL